MSDEQLSVDEPMKTTEQSLRASRAWSRRPALKRRRRIDAVAQQHIAADVMKPPRSELDCEANEAMQSVSTSDGTEERLGDAADLSQSATDNGSKPSRRRGFARVICFGVLPVVALLSTLGVAYLKYQEVTNIEAERARVESVQAAKDSAVAMLSYAPNTADTNLTAARDRLTGNFRDSYTSLTHDVVIPGAKEQKISATATVPAAASVSASADHAVALIFVNQAIVIGNGAPSQTDSVVQVTLDKVDNRWLISGFDPK
jgi:Mce-associated membrane protein